jgi:hypothetical protein
VQIVDGKLPALPVAGCALNALEHCVYALGGNSGEGALDTEVEFVQTWSFKQHIPFHASRQTFKWTWRSMRLCTPSLPSISQNLKLIDLSYALVH